MKIDREKLRAKADIQIVLHQSDFHPRDSFETQEDIDWALSQLERGNDWGWCCVEVRAAYGGHTASDFLGGCSYADERTFKVLGGYYEDMVWAAVDELARTLEHAYAAIDDLVQRAPSPNVQSAYEALRKLGILVTPSLPQDRETDR